METRHYAEIKWFDGEREQTRVVDAVTGEREVMQYALNLAAGTLDPRRPVDADIRYLGSWKRY